MQSNTSTVRIPRPTADLVGRRYFKALAPSRRRTNRTAALAAATAEALA